MQRSTDQSVKDRTALMDLRATADRLTAQVGQLTVVWDAVDQVDTNLGVEVEEAGRGVMALLDALAGMTGAVDPLRTRQLQREAIDLHEAVEYYAEFDEHETDASIDIFDRLMPGIALAQRVLDVLDSPAAAQRVTVGEFIERLRQFPPHLQVWSADATHPAGCTPFDRTVTMGENPAPGPGDPSSFVVVCAGRAGVFATEPAGNPTAGPRLTGSPLVPVRGGQPHRPKEVDMMPSDDTTTATTTSVTMPTQPTGTETTALSHGRARLVLGRTPNSDMWGWDAYVNDRHIRSGVATADTVEAVREQAIREAVLSAPSLVSARDLNAIAAASLDTVLDASGNPGDSTATTATTTSEATSEAGPDTGRLTAAQIAALSALCDRFRVLFDPTAFAPTFDLPAGYVAGWVGPIYVGCDPDGVISS